METSAVILAAGKGTRMKSERPKVLHRCFGEPMIQHVCRSLRRSEVNSLTAVLGTGKEQVEDVLPPEVETVEQEEQLGTGHAVGSVMDHKKFPNDSVVMVACGDIPGVSPSTYSRVLEPFREDDVDVTVLTARLDDPEGYGRVVIGDDGEVERIVEHKDATDAERDIDLINTGIICARADVFDEYIPRLSDDNESGEYYLTDVVGLVRGDGGRVLSVEADDAWEVTGINTRPQLVKFEREGYRRRNEELLRNGVTVHDPHRVKIGPWVEVERDAEFEGDVTIVGESSVGEGSYLSGRVKIQSATIGRDNEICDSTITLAELSDRVRVGPYCHVRPGSIVGDDVRLGNFVEIKNSDVDSDTNIAHLSYIGDADIGSGVNVGAGTITCNYDGYDKHRTTIQDDVFIGSNAELVAPVTIGEGALIGAGSTVTKDVPPYSLSLSRADEEIRENWVKEVWKPRKEDR